MASAIILSDNRKTINSVNFDHATCRPTAACAAYCYGRGRTAAEGLKLGVTGNGGPITWPVQQASYRRNRLAVMDLHRQGMAAIAAEAARISRSLRRRKLLDLRWNGMGDLFPEVLPLIGQLASFGVHVWGFSRKPELIVELSAMCRSWGVADMPYFIGSLDASTLEADAEALVAATALLNGAPALSYMTALPGATGCEEVDQHPHRSHMAVVYGYHTNVLHTKLGHTLECPATTGDAVPPGYCLICRRCVDGHKEI